MGEGQVTEDRPAAATDAGRRRRASWRGPGLVAGLLAFVALIAVIGFVRFAVSVSSDPGARQPAPADGIVVFTGGQDRIAGAVALLADGIARRLLISGVHPRTTRSMLSEYTGADSELFRCCIDLGRDARDTIGNADETAAWARSHGFKSLIVVTSSYHMPRSLTELARALPGVRLEGHPVVASSLNLAHWWRDPDTVRLLAWEYVKYLAASARLAVSPSAQAEVRHAGQAQ